MGGKTDEIIIVEINFFWCPIFVKHLNFLKVYLKILN